jgi:hypothetical protein
MIYFSSDRSNNLDPKTVPANFKMQHYDFGQAEIYKMEIITRQITRITTLPASDETSPVQTPDGKHLLFISDMNGINNVYVENLDSGSIRPVTNSLSGVYQLSLSHDGGKLAFSSLSNSGFDLFLMRNPLDREINVAELEKTEYFRRLLERPRSGSTPAKKDSVHLGDDIVVKMVSQDSTSAYGNDTKIDLRNYVFNDAFRGKQEKSNDTVKFPSVIDNVDANGNYKVNKYKLNFSPDIIYGNAGYNTFYGVQGSTVMAFSDMLGNHQFYILTNLLFDLKNSDYALAYLYMPKRVDYGVQIFHNARFLLLTDPQNQEYLYRFRNYGVTAMASYPIDKFNRWEANLSWFNITKDNLDLSYLPTQKRSVVVPGISYIHDTSLWGLLAPANGDRYNVSFMMSPKFSGETSLGFYSLTLDYRKYFKLWRNYTFVVRAAGGGSFGQNPQRFIIGGVDGWINRQFENNHFPLDNPEDFVFLTSGIPLRGYNYNARIGTKYGIMNLEFRFPLFGYLSAGPLPIFFQSLNGVLFLDMGGAWEHRSDFKAFDRNANGDLYLRDLLTGAGYGVRMVFLGFLLKMDVAWSFNLQETSVPKYYFSVGADI